MLHTHMLISITYLQLESALVSSRSIVMHSQQMLNVLNTKSSYPRSLLSADDILSPLDALYDFGEMGTVYPADPTLRPVALLGDDTGLLGACPSFHEAANLTWRGKTVGDGANMHLTVEACDPKSGLRWFVAVLLDS